MTTFATGEGTKKYAARFAGRVAEEHFRVAEPADGLALSSIGIGTYLGDADARTDAAYTEAVVAAVRGGANVIDSAINYRMQRGERSIGAAVAQLLADGYTRDELVICTKGGYLTPDGEMPANPREYFKKEFFDKGICTPEEISGGAHCMTPRYLEDQLGRSLRNLGVDCADVYYLHNASESQLGAVEREEYYLRLRRAFEFLEGEAAKGRIRYYGMATWDCFRQDPRAQGYESLEKVVRIAAGVAGAQHRFRFVQMPYNLGMPEALVAANQRLGDDAVPMVKAAQELGVALIASASLLQTRLRGLPAFVSEALGQSGDVANALQFVRSSPGIATALVGMSQRAHVEENLKLAAVPPVGQEQFMKLFERK